MTGTATDSTGDDFINSEAFLTLRRVQGAIVFFDAEDKINQIGTVTFLQYRGRYFAATGGHLARDARKGTWIICASESLQLSHPENGKLLGQKVNNKDAILSTNEALGFGLPCWRIDQPGEHELLRDVGLIEIHEIGPLLEAGHVFYPVGSMTQQVPEVGAMVEIWGECAVPLHDDRLEARTARVITRVLDVEEGLLVLKGATVKYFEVATKADGGTTGFSSSANLPQSVKGMSGGPVWHGDSPTAQPSLIGIQCAVGPGESTILVARITDWCAAADEYLAGSSLDPEQNEAEL